MTVAISLTYRMYSCKPSMVKSNNKNYSLTSSINEIATVNPKDMPFPMQA
jgi:hypothetical protein